MPSSGLASDNAVLEHQPGAGHPEQPARHAAVLNAIAPLGLQPIAVTHASEAQIGLVHSAAYIELVQREIAERRGELSTGDTAISPGSLHAAVAAAGCCVAAVDAVFSGEVTNAFCAVRPPGHHASADRGMGFCIFNNVAIAARYAQSKYAAERVLIADWDVHHGNGTQEAFYADGSVLFFSTHQSPWYPGTGSEDEQGEGAGMGATINCPFPAYSSAETILSAFRTRLIPAARAFRPDLILISAGFDSRAGDPLGLFLLTDDDFAELTRMMTDLAADLCDHRLVSVLEGGYSLEGLASASVAHVGALQS